MKSRPCLNAGKPVLKRGVNVEEAEGGGLVLVIESEVREEIDRLAGIIGGWEGVQNMQMAFSGQDPA